MIKFLKRLLVITIVFNLTMVNFLILSKNLAIAVYEELETQTVKTSQKNVELDAYFKTSQGKMHSKLMKISEDNNLYVRVTVNDTGVLNDAKIKIENTNFKIIKEKVNSEFVKEVNDIDNEITLNQIVYGNSVEIEVPIKFEKQPVIDVNYFDMQNTIKLTAIYKDEKEKQIEAGINTRAMWTDDVEIETDQTIEKYFALGEEGKDGVLLQEALKVNVKNDILPRENENIKINVPNIENEKPKSVTILLNGNKLEESKDYSYDSENGILKINQANEKNGENKIVWGKAENQYKIIYLYDAKIGETDRQIALDANISEKLYAKEQIQKTDSKNVDITKKGEIVSINTSMTQSVNKGYLYAASQNETIYNQTTIVEVSEINSIGDVELIINSANYISNEQGTKYNAKDITYYKSTIINKDNMNKILGTDGIVTIKNENGQILKQILASDEADNAGNFAIVYDVKELHKIQITTTKPIQEGELVISNTKAIKGDTGLRKIQLKEFTQLGEEVEVIANTKTSVASSEMELLDTITEANLKIAQANLSTLQTNQNVELTVTLNSNNEKYDLYKNPYMEIQFPEEVESININSVNKLFADEFEMAYDIQENKIRIQLTGEQTEFKNDVNKGVQVTINANIAVNKDTPSKESTIKMLYTNENGNESSYETEEKINFVSQYGAFVYTEVEKYNKNGNSVVAKTNESKMANLDIGEEEKIATVNMAVLNNYENEMDQVNIVGKIQKANTEENGEEQNTFLSELTGAITTNLPDVTIYYSYEDVDTNSDKWSQNVEDYSKVKAYKIVLNGGKLANKQLVKISYQIKIPANLTSNKNETMELNVDYSYQGQNMQANSKVVLATPAVAQNYSLPVVQNVEAQNGIETGVVVTSAGRNITNGDSIYEGETLKYNVKVTNYTDEKLTNVKMIANHTNAVFFGEVEKKVIATEGEQEIITELYYEEDESLTQKEITIESIEPGETATFEYEFSLKKKDDTAQTSGKIVISADNKDNIEIDALTNPIQDAELKLVINSLGKISKKFYSNSEFSVKVDVENLSDTQQDGIFELQVPDYMTLNTENMGSEYDFISFENQVVKLKINVDAKEKKGFILAFFIGEMPSGEDENLNLTAQITSNTNKTYASNTLTKTIYQADRPLEVVQTANVEGDTVKNGDGIVYNFAIKNRNQQDAEARIFYLIPDGITIQRVYSVKNDTQEDIEIKDGYVSKKLIVEPEEVVYFIVEAKVNTNNVIQEQENISSSISVTVDGKEINSNVLEYKINYEDDEENSGGENKPTNPDDENNKPTNPDDENNKPTNPDDENNKPTNPDDEVMKPIEPDKETDTKSKYQISGVAWIDANKNGLRESSEKFLPNIKVKLLDEKTGNIVKEIETNENGEYVFNELSNGEYIISFEYDGVKYRTTEYKKQGVNEQQNSDIIYKGNSDSKVMAITDTLKLEGQDILNIDAGFIQNEKFDFSLTKNIKQIIVRNSSETKTYDFNGTQLAKVEIDTKKMSNCIVLIEYQITVKNEGELAGYVNEIVDYIPKDLKFSSEINKDWYISTDGILHNVSITGLKINPGESKTLSLTLSKTITSDNLGTTINTAEIKKTTNELSLKDIDSTEGNRAQGEDDISTAKAIISVKTGLVITISFGIIFSIIVGVGVVLYILKRKEEKNEKGYY